MYRFLLVFSLLLPFQSFALDFVMTDDSLKVFQNKKEAIVSFSLEDNFLIGHQATQKIKEKLGAYKLRSIKYSASTSELAIDQILKQGDSLICTGFVSGKNLESKFTLLFIEKNGKVEYQISFENPGINFIDFKLSQ